MIKRFTVFLIFIILILNSCSETKKDKIITSDKITHNKVDTSLLNIDLLAIKQYNDTLIQSSEVLKDDKIYIEKIINYFYKLKQSEIDSSEYSLQTTRNTQNIIIGDEIVGTCFSAGYSRYVAEKNYSFDGLTEIEKIQSPNFQKVYFKFIDIDKKSNSSKIKTNLNYPNFDYVLYFGKRYKNLIYTELVPKEYHENKETKGKFSLKYHGAHIFIFELDKNKEIIDVYRDWLSIE